MRKDVRASLGTLNNKIDHARSDLFHFRVSLKDLRADLDALLDHLNVTTVDVEAHKEVRPKQEKENGEEEK